ncbi:MAG: HAMP domain-containing histidine kinase [Deltaproteobacteria bacterium]|nr:HAMP domain-containing histidine kinase [Deltaproteobacteria bacterium]
MARHIIGRFGRRRRPWLNPVVWISLAQVTWIAVLVLWIVYYVRRYEGLNELALGLREASLHPDGWGALVWGVVLLCVLFTALVFITVGLTRYWSENRAIHAFVSTVSHELRTPLATVKLYLETMQAHPDLAAEKRAEFLQTVLADVDRLAASIDAILEASRLERRGVEFDLTPIDLGQFVRGYHADHAPLVELRRRRLELGPVEPSTVVANSEALTTVLNNLVENAVRYSTEGCAVTLSLQRDRHWTRLEVIDRGRGISARDLKKVYKMFYRGHESAGVRGTGLGLFIVRSLVRAMRGEIAIRSQGADRGTVVSLSFPTIEAGG